MKAINESSIYEPLCQHFQMRSKLKQAILFGSLERKNFRQDSNVDLQDTITLNLTRSVQLSADVAEYWFAALAQHGYMEREFAKRMLKVVGFVILQCNNMKPLIGK